MPLLIGFPGISVAVEGGQKTRPAMMVFASSQFLDGALEAPFLFPLPGGHQMTRNAIISALNAHADALNRFRRATCGLDVIDRVEIAERLTALHDSRHRRQGPAVKRTPRGRRPSIGAAGRSAK
jgi:hypothetical protein